MSSSPIPPAIGFIAFNDMLRHMENPTAQATETVEFWKRRYMEEHHDHKIELRHLRTLYLNLKALYREKDAGIEDHLQQQLRDAFKANGTRVDCNICCEAIKYENLKTGKCGHHFCKDCIDKWLEQSNTCAICRKQNQFNNNVSLITL